MARMKTGSDTSRRDLITTTAAALFTEKGFKAASMRELAERVGVEAASLYNHIKGKPELLHNICLDVANRFWEHIHALEAAPGGPLAKVETLFRFHIREMINNYEAVHVSDREWKHLAEPYLTNFQNQRREYRKKIAALIEDGIEAGELKNIDAPTATLLLLHAVSGLDSWHRSRKRISAEEIEENMVAIMITGLQR
jgi:AcrR family transcriptional regulator